MSAQVRQLALAGHSFDGLQREAEAISKQHHQPELDARALGIVPVSPVGKRGISVWRRRFSPRYLQRE